MTYSSRLLIVAVTQLLLACGGETKGPSSGGAGGSGAVAGSGQAGDASSHAGHANGGSANGGASGGSTNGGSTNGGNANGGTSGGPTVCCNAFPVCPSNERQARDSECPGHASCHELTVCCSSIWCVASDGSGGAAGSSGAGAHDCNGQTCSATQACVAYRTLGGPLLLADAGACPTGTHLEGDRCDRDFAYQCADLHGACANQPVSCACAQPPAAAPGVCPSNYGSCSPSDPAADPSAQLICQQLAP